MKKIFLAVLAFTLIVVFASCAADTVGHDSAINDLNSKIEELTNQITALESKNNKLQGIIDDSEFPLFQEWIEQESSMSERAAYETIVNAFDSIDDEISRGWLDEGTIKFLRVIKGSIITDQTTTSEILDIYNSLDKRIGDSGYSIRDFFCVDEYGNPTNTGIYNFLETIDQLEAQKFSGKDLVFVQNGNVVGWDFSEIGDDKIAEALGISSELFLIILHAAVDAGFDISFG